jgi:hypothetical protein
VRLHSPIRYLALHLSPISRFEAGESRRGRDVEALQVRGRRCINESRGRRQRLMEWVGRTLRRRPRRPAGGGFAPGAFRAVGTAAGRQLAGTAATGRAIRRKEAADEAALMGSCRRPWWRAGRLRSSESWRLGCRRRPLERGRGTRRRRGGGEGKGDGGEGEVRGRRGRESKASGTTLKNESI